MAIGISQEVSAYGIPVWQDTPENFQGGFKLVTTGLTANEILPAGTPMYVDESARTATPLKTAVAQANATNSATDIKVLKGHFLAVGDFLAKTVGSKAYAITAITTTETDYDTVSIGTTLGAAITAGDVLFVSSAEGASAAALNVTPNGLLYQSVKIESNTACAVAYKGAIYERRVTQGIPSAVKSVLYQILFSASK